MRSFTATICFVSILCGQWSVSKADSTVTVTTVDDAEFLVTTPGVFAEQTPSSQGITLKLVEGSVDGNPYFDTGTHLGIEDFSLADLPNGSVITNAYVTLDLNQVDTNATIRTSIRAGNGTISVSDAISIYTSPVFTETAGAGVLQISLNSLLTELNQINGAADYVTVYHAIAYGDNGLGGRYDSLESADAGLSQFAPTLTVTSYVPEPAFSSLLFAGLFLARRHRRSPARRRWIPHRIGVNIGSGRTQFLRGC